MSLYKKAGLVQIPSGYKADKLYSVVPNNGDGDFDFTRASTATRVNKDGLIETVATGTPRLDYPLLDGVVQDNPVLLLEPSRQNVLQRSEEFENSYWNKSLISVTANDSVSPDGSVTADKIVSGNSTGAHFFRRTGLTYSATDNTFSIFAKFTDDLFKQFHFIIYDGSNHFVYFDVKNGNVISADSGVTASMINYGNGWYRCVATYQTASTSVGQIKVELGNSTNVTGDGSSGMLFWGIQWEVGSYPTSYIKTQGETNGVTRSADICNGAGTANDFNDSEGVLYANIAKDSTGVDGAIAISDSSYTNRVLFYFDTSGNIRGYIYASGEQARIDTSGLNYTNNNKIALKYSTASTKFYVNGFQVGVTDTSSTMPTGLSELAFDDGGGGSDFYGKTKEVMTFKEALSDIELETLTSYRSFNEMATEQLYTIK